MADFTQQGTALWATREVVDADWDAIAGIINQHETQIVTGDILRERQSLIGPSNPCLRVVALDMGGHVIAYCRALQRSHDVPGIFRISLFVNKDNSGHGLGRYLLNGAERFIRQHGGQYAMTSVEESAKRCIDFAAKAGYAPVQHLFESRLDLQGFDASPYQMAQSLLEDAGYRFPNFESLGTTDENWKKLHELDTVSDRDTPGSEFWSLGTVDEYRAQHSPSLGFSANGVHLAVINGQWVGMNSMKASQKSGEYQTVYTGVLREHRGKGIAQTLKVLGIQYAIACGAQSVVTNNDDRNAPMLAINKKLGFVQEEGFFVVRKQITAPAVHP